jgi:hypothetical protein
MSDFARLQELARQAGLQVNAPSVVDIPAVMPLEATVGTALTCTMGNWTGEPTEYAYSWTSNGTEVGTGASYTAAAGDAGHSLACVVTATNNVGSTTASPSNAVTVAAVAARRAEPAAHDAHSDARRK